MTSVKARIVITRCMTSAKARITTVPVAVMHSSLHVTDPGRKLKML